MLKKLVFLFCFVLLFVVFAQADTLTNKKTGKVYHGYVINKKVNSKTMVKTAEAGFQKLKLSKWKIQYNHQGRNDLVAIVPLDAAIEYQQQIKAFEKSLDIAISKGPKFVIIPISSQGSRSDISKKMASVISKAARYTPVYAYINSEQSDGAINAAILPALACNKIYINPSACVGGVEDANEPNDIEFEDRMYLDMREIFGDVIGEKFTSAVRGFTSSLAQQNNKPHLLAMAMVDKNIEVIQVQDSSDTNLPMFLEPVNFTANLKEIKTWSKSGELLLLNAEQATQSGLADGQFESVDAIISKLATGTQTQTIDEHFATKEKLDKKYAELKRISSKMKALIKRLKDAPSTSKKSLISKLIKEYQKVLTIAKRNPDLGIDISVLKMIIDSLKIDYELL